MSPEIINGHEYDLPTDVFSLGIIFVEILSRGLVDSRTYTVSSTTLTSRWGLTHSSGKLQASPPIPMRSEDGLRPDAHKH